MLYTDWITQILLAFTVVVGGGGYKFLPQWSLVKKSNHRKKYWMGSKYVLLVFLLYNFFVILVIPYYDNS